MDNEFMLDYEKNNKRSKILLIILIVVITLLLLLLGSVFFLKISYNKILFNESLDYAYETIFKNSNGTNKEILSLDKKQIDTTLTLSTNLSDGYKQALGLTELDLESIGLNFLIQLDDKNKQAFYDIKYLENTQNILNLKMFIDENGSYISYPNLYDKVIKVGKDKENNYNDTFTIDEQTSINDKDLARIIYLTKEIVKENLDNNHIIKEKETISIEENDYELNKYSYKLKGQEYKNFIVKILNDIKLNQELINALVNYTGKDETKVLSTIDELIDEANTITNEELEFNLYTTGLFRKVVGFELVEKDTTDEYNIKFLMIKEKIKLEIISNANVITIEGHKEEDITRLTYIENYELKANITLKQVGNTIDIVMSDPDNTYAVKFNIYSLKENNITTSNFVIEYVTSDNNINIKLDLQLQIKPIDTIATIDYSNAIDEDNISEEDRTTISNNLMTELSKSKLINFFIDYYESLINNYPNEDKII